MNNSRGFVELQDFLYSMGKIKVLYVITKLELGGAQKQLLSLIECLDKERFSPFLFTAKEGLLIQDAVLIKGLVIRKSNYLVRSINPLKDILAFFEIYWFIQNNHITVVHTHSSKAGILGRLAAKLARVKFIVHTVHGWSFNDYQAGLFRIFTIALEKFIGHFTDQIIVVSGYDRENGLRHQIGQKNKYRLIRYGIDYNEFTKKQTPLRQTLGIDQSDLVVTNISCFKPQKAPLDFIRLACLITQSFSRVKFLFVGDGQLRKDIEKLIAKLNLQDRVILTGWRRDIPEILSATDVLVLTSLWEGLPIVVLEAMALGCPVVATATGGIEEVISEGRTGFLVLRKDIVKLTENLSLLLKNENLRKTIGKGGRDFLGSDFSIANMVRDNQNLYCDLIRRQDEK